MNWVKALIDDVIADEFDSPDLEFSWNNEASIDPQKQEAILTSYATKGILTINEAARRWVASRCRRLPPTRRWFHQYPPSAGQWADPNYNIPGWRVLGQNETPMPGDVVAQRIDYSDATGHVMIVGPDHTVIGTGPLDGQIEQVTEPSILGHDLRERGIAFGPKIYRRWGN